jgi:hypothetical protein
MYLKYQTIRMNHTVKTTDLSQVTDKLYRITLHRVLSGIRIHNARCLID